MAQVGGYLVAVNATSYTLPGKSPEQTESWRTFLPGTNVTLRGVAKPRNQEQIGLGPAAPSYPVLWQDSNGKVGLTTLRPPENAVWFLSAYHWLIKEHQVFHAALPYIKRTNRSAAGISEDGRWLFLVACGPSNQKSSKDSGASLPELAEFMLSLGVANALNFDGGSSTSMIIKQQKSYLLTPPPEKYISRPVPVILGITPNH
nr:phosphodiester glycosidase family protein [Cerasicoccus arenae]